MPLCYIAYPTSLTLQSANAIQTWTTLRELRRLAPSTLALIPRSWRAPSHFTAVGARHLPRPAIGRLSRLHRTTLLYYLEHSLFAWMCLGALLLERLRGRRYGAIYIRQTVCAAWWAGCLGRLYGAPVIYEAHDWESHNPSRAKERWAVGLLHLMDRVALTRSAAVVSLTEHFLRQLRADGWLPRNSAVIPDAFDALVYQPEDRATARHHLGLDPDVLLVVYAGMTFSYRGLDRLVAAFAAAALPNARLIFVGGRPTEIEGLRAQAEQLGLLTQLLLTGPQPQTEVAHYLAAADLLVIPDTVTDVTASPLKLFEYMAMGRPIITVDLPALREVINEQAARFVRRGSITELAAALRELAADPDHREAMGHAARRQAQAWTYTRRAERILAVAATVELPSWRTGIVTKQG
ncbi:MAG: glycosyltransferase [Herpetosiphonaceae bacterium]|nr:glycosyltransferase [Herpetosiphonaceae bacterium]